MPFSFFFIVLYYGLFTYFLFNVLDQILSIKEQKTDKGIRPLQLKENKSVGELTRDSLDDNR